LIKRGERDTLLVTTSVPATKHVDTRSAPVTFSFKGAFDRTEGLTEIFLTAVRDMNPEETARRTIESAVGWSRRLHFPQEDRLEFGADAYVNHPLEVATRLVRDFKVKDTAVIVAALLHDTLEDQPGLLASLVPPSHTDQHIVEPATRALRQLFGDDVTELVSALTNPDFYALIDAEGITDPSMRRARRNALYAEHVMELLEHNPRAGIIKTADLMHNALRLDELPTEEKRSNFRLKYGPVLNFLVTSLSSADATHPLFNVRSEILEALADGMRRSGYPEPS
jgi:(p)ppGpp synthase/HD superfamily hydrolase